MHSFGRLTLRLSMLSLTNLVYFVTVVAEVSAKTLWRYSPFFVKVGMRISGVALGIVACMLALMGFLCLVVNAMQFLIGIVTQHQSERFVAAQILEMACEVFAVPQGYRIYMELVMGDWVRAMVSSVWSWTELSAHARTKLDWNGENVTIVQDIGARTVGILNAEASSFVGSMSKSVLGAGGSLMTLTTWLGRSRIK